MKFSVVILLFTSHLLLAQSVKIEEKIKLSKKISETSGIVFLDNEILTFNDSGGKPKLYVLKPSSGKIKRTIKIKNALNVDWESITQDEKFVYIGDTGNNYGNRKNLVIYKVSKKDIQTQDKVKAEKIYYSYTNQKRFVKESHQSNFDCEAMTIYKNQLYLFTKNWKDNQTNIYALPNSAGVYQANPIKSLTIDCLLTSIAYNSEIDSFVGTAYDRNYQSYILIIKDFETVPLISKISLTATLGYSNQTEAIAWKNNHQIYVTREASQKKLNGKHYKRKQKLFLITLTD
ncbi:hypothetical protein QVZ41_12870 [Wenyingzhuangia sp. chi5]|uniref:T9SS C-terminal target domain-containing protein n=1 Tax=Wenyingzhuangia gilva TaxID=3057677 RepID=A0ABT8VUT1_9FLAO|nr:hypothetical protein [Wenyingzhuangia sp. chi5]MDO3695735.1 hypothetical protein [Wenyingzhuangia sp. chi5]